MKKIVSCCLIFLNTGCCKALCYYFHFGHIIFNFIVHKMKLPLKIVFPVFVLSFFSCQNDDAPVVYEEGSNEYANQWMYGQMKKYYYWNESIGGQGDLSSDSKQYFEGLLNPADRFSYAFNAAMPETLPQRMAGKFGFDITFVNYQGQVFGVILYVFSDSPAQRAGLHRGQLITEIEGVTLNSGNYESLYNNLLGLENIKLKLTEFSEDTGFSDSYLVNVSQGFTFLQPVRHRIITGQNKKTGYIEIPHFDVGLAQSLLNAFQDFKSQSVTNVIVDLRYNGGGDVSSAAALSILLAPGIEATDLFIKFKGNKNGGEVNQSFKEALEMNEPHVSFDALRNAHPLINRVYILCGSHTASASEIIINNLRPFMQVITIGEKTVGKDVASFAIEDDRIPGQPGWIMYPAIYKISNANSDGNYDAGILPSNTVDELQKLQIYPLGDVREVLLNEVLNSIASNGRIAGNTNTQPLLKINYGLGVQPIILDKKKIQITN